MLIPVNHVFLFFIFLGIYLKIHGAGIVFVFAFLCALLAGLRYKKIMGAVPYIALLAALVVMQLLAIGDLSKDAMRYFIYMMTNMFTIIASLALLSDAVPRRTGGGLLFTMVLFIVLAIMEVYVGMKPAFDAIRGLYTSDTSTYDAVNRDLAQYGQVRPVVFTSEPSSLGNFFGAVWLSYCCIVRVNGRNIVKALLLMAAAMVIFRSPTLVGYLSVAPAMVMVKSSRSKIGYIYLLLLLGVVTIVLPVVWANKNMLPPGPLYDFFASGSFFIRQISPLLTVQSAMETAPILGLGPKFHETSQQVSSVFLSLMFGGYYTPDKLTQMPPREFASNALWQLIGTLGIGGLIFFLGILRSAMVHFRVRQVNAVILCTLILMVSHAGIVLTFSWVPLLLLAYSFMDPPKKGLEGSENV